MPYKKKIKALDAERIEREEKFESSVVDEALMEGTPGAPQKKKYVKPESARKKREKKLLKQAKEQTPASDVRASFEKSRDSKDVIVKTGYEPRAQQLEIHQDEHRFKVVVAHRRLGKSTAALNHIIWQALEVNPGKRFWFIAPTYRQAKMIAMRDLKRYLPPELIVKKNENELVFELFNGSEIALKGADNEDSLRGAGLAGVVFDEFQAMDRTIWEAVIRPTLAEEKGWAIFLGTPNGRNHFYELYQKGKSPDNVEWTSFHWSVMDTGIFPPEEIENERRDTSEEYFRQEWLAEFLEGSGTVFRHVQAVLINELPPNGVQPKWDESYQMGVDLARYQDFTVFTVLNHRGEMVYWNRFNQLDWEVQKLKILHVSEMYHHCPIVLDATGVGDPVLDSLQQMGANVRGYKINSSSQKKALIENLQIKIEQMQVRIAKEKQLVHELESFKYEITDSGRTRYSVPQGYHDDCVMSLALAAWDLPLTSSSGSRLQDKLLPYNDDF